MLRDIEKQKERSTEVGTRQTKLVRESEKELIKAEKQKDSELQMAQTLYDEANERISQAI